MRILSGQSSSRTSAFPNSRFLSKFIVPHALLLSAILAFIHTDTYAQVVNPTQAGLIEQAFGVTPNLTGATSVDVKGNYAYVVGIGDVLEILDITLPGLPIHKGILTNGTDGASIQRPQHIKVIGNYAYITSYAGNALEIVDVSDPAHPKHKGILRDGGGVAPYLAGAWGLDIVGNYAYVSSGVSNALEIIDISNPSSPVHKGSLLNGDGINPPFLEGPVSVTVSGNLAYVGIVGDGSPEPGIEIIDISNPASPVHAGYIANGNGVVPYLTGPYNIRIVGNHAYVPDPSGALEILDLSNPAAPVHKGSIEMGGTLEEVPNLAGAFDVAISGNYAFVVGGYTFFEVVDITDPAAPTHVTSLTNQLFGLSRDIKIVGNLAYIPSRSFASLTLMDITNPAAPIIKSSVVTPPGGAILEKAQALLIDGDYAYVGNKANGPPGTVGFEIVNVSNPSSPVHTGALRHGISGNVANLTTSLAKANNLVYLVGGTAMTIVDVSFPTAPVQRSFIYDDISVGPLIEMPTSVRLLPGYPDFVFITSYAHSAVQIMEVSDPDAPFHFFTLHDGNGTPGNAPYLDRPTSMEIVNDKAFVTSFGSDALEILDVGPGSASHVSALLDGNGVAPFLSKPKWVFVKDDYAYVASYGSSALEIVDVTNISSPVHKGSFKSPLLDSVNHVFVSGNYAYATCAQTTMPNGAVFEKGRLVVIDVSDPANPTHYATFTHGTSGALLDYPTSVTVRDGYAYITNAGQSWALNTVYLYGPGITSFSPESTSVGSTVTVTGKNFNSFVTAQINGQEAEINQVMENEIIIKVPEGATNGKITLKHQGQSFSSPQGFVVVPSTIQATDIDQTSFKANWSNVGAIAYILDVSTDHFDTFVPGYDSFPVQNLNSHVIAGLSPGTIYEYRIRAYDGVILSDTSNISPLITIPATPSALVANAITQNSFNLTWDSAPGATGYFLDVATDNTFTTFLAGLNNLAVTSSSQAVSGAASGTPHYYRVRSVNQSGTSPSSAMGTVVTIPATVTPLTASAISAAGFTANWTASPGTTDYRLDVSTDNFSTFVTGLENLAVGTDLSKPITGLTSGTTYQYRVRAANASGNSANSASISLITLPAATVLQPVTSVSANSFTVGWTAVVGAASYSVDVATDNAFLALIYNNVNVNNQTSYSAASLSPNTTYYVRVRANNASAGSGANSNVVSTTTLTPPPTTQSGSLVFSAITEASITVNFTPGNGASHLLVVNSTSALSTLPTNGIAYAGQTVYGQGAAIGTGYAVSNGVGPVTITGLAPSTLYFFHVYDFNGSGGAENYLTSGTSATNPRSQTTFATMPGAQPTNLRFSSSSSTSVTVSYTAAIGSASGYIAIRSIGAEPSTAPASGTAYPIGTVLGNATVAYVGSALSFFDAGLLSATEYFYNVYSFNGEGTTTIYRTTAPLKDKVTLDVEAPIIGNNTNPGTITAGNTPLFTALITDNVRVDTAKIFYRGISGSEFKSSTMQTAGGSVYNVQIQTSWYDSLGLEYYFWAKDKLGNVTTKPSGTNFAQILYSSISLPILPSGTDQTSYRIVAFPYTLSTDNKVTTVYSNVPWNDNTKAALWWWDPSLKNGEGDYDQYGSGTLETVDPGKGYWMITAAPATPLLTNVTAPKYNHLNLYPMTLEPDWNEIGNPYPVAISWDDVIAYNELLNPGADFGPLNTYDGSGYKKTNMLPPFEGGFVRNLGTSEVTIQIPFPDQTTGGRKSTIGQDISEENWNLSLLIEQDGRVNRLGGFGMHKSAHSGADRYDNFNPPSFFETPELRFSNTEAPGQIFSNDMVRSRAEYTWQFTSSGREGTRTRLTWDLPAMRNSSRELFLLDEENVTIIDMSAQTGYEFVMTRNNRFRIFFGANIRDKIKTARIAAGNVYPNPTLPDGRTNINVALPESGSEYTVTLQIYNLQGQLFGSINRKLPPGIHPLEFDMSNAPGGSMYVYKLAINNDNGSAVFAGKIVKP